MSELSKVEQRAKRAKVRVLLGSQGMWHTECFYKEKKNADMVLSSVKYHNFHLAVFEALASGSSLEWLTSFQQRETCDPQGITTGLMPCPNTRLERPGWTRSLVRSPKLPRMHSLSLLIKLA